MCGISHHNWITKRNYRMPSDFIKSDKGGKLMFDLDVEKNKKIYILGIIYIVFLTILGGIINYFTWKEGSVTGINYIYILIWIALYLPILVFRKYAQWKITEFGFSVNYRLLILFLIFLYFIFRFIESISFSFENIQIIFMETFARTGEELFYRGFVYTLILKLFKDKRKPWIWAVLLSSASFTLIHTQIFLPEYYSRIVDIFGLAVLLALFRHWTKSILPGMLIHISFKTGFSGVILGVIGYMFMILVAFIKGEKVVVKKETKSCTADNTP